MTLKHFISDKGKIITEFFLEFKSEFFFPRSPPFFPFLSFIDFGDSVILYHKLALKSIYNLC